MSGGQQSSRYFHVDRNGVAAEQSVEERERSIFDAFSTLGYPPQAVAEMVDGILILTADGMPEDKATELMLATAKGDLKRGPVEMAEHIVKLRKAIR